MNSDFLRFLNGISMAKRLYDTALEPVCQRFNKTRMEVDILLFLANNPSLDTAAEIVKIRRLTKSHVSVSIDALVNCGCIEKRYKDGNSKSAHLVLLPEAEAIIDEGRAAQQNFINILNEGLTEDEIKTMAKVFNIMGKNMEAAFKERD